MKYPNQPARHRKPIPQPLHSVLERRHKANGGNYQTMINDALRYHIQSKDGELEKTLRLVVREELAKYNTE